MSAQLVGVKGKSGDMDMDQSPELFDSKSVDSFTRVVEDDLGDLTEINVWHDGSGGGLFGGADWFMDKVVVEHALTERT